MKRAIVLLRVSTEGQAAEDRNGLAAQRAACEQLVARYGLTVEETVELIDVSGTSIMATPEMAHLLRLLETGEYHGVVVREFSRALRPTNYDYFLFQVMADTHCTLYTDAAVIEPWTSTGRMMVAMHGVIAANELDTILGRMMAGKEELRKKGKWAGSARTLPYGVAYDRAAGTFSYLPEKAALIVEVYRRFLAGETNYDALSDVLGVSRGTAKNILTNPIYAGWLVFDQQRDLTRRQHRADGRQGDRRKVARPPEKVIRNKVIAEPLISEEDWERVQAIVGAKRNERLRQRTRTGLFTYAGFLWCAECGARVHTCRNLSSYFYFCSSKKHGGTCRTQYMLRDRLEPLLDRVVARTLANEQALRRIAREQTSGAAARTAQQQAARAGRLVEALRGKRGRILELFTEGLIDRTERDTKLKVLEAELARAEETAARLAPSKPAWDPATVAALFAPLGGWKRLDRAEKRRLLATLSPHFAVARYPVTGFSIQGVTVGPFAKAARVSNAVDSRSKMGRFPSPAPPCLSPSRRASCWPQP